MASESTKLGQFGQVFSQPAPYGPPRHGLGSGDLAAFRPLGLGPGRDKEQRQEGETGMKGEEGKVEGRSGKHKKREGMDLILIPSSVNVRMQIRGIMNIWRGHIS